MSCSCPFNGNNVRFTTWYQIFPSLIYKTWRLTISECCIWLFIFLWKTAEKARALGNCFLHMYLFLDKCACLKVCNTMEMDTMEMYSWEVEALEMLTQSLLFLCDGLNATCFSLLCVGSFSTVYNKWWSCMKDTRNLLISFLRD